MCCFQEAEAARRDLLELQAVAAAVESSGQAKAEAQVCTIPINQPRLVDGDGGYITSHQHHITSKHTTTSLYVAL